MVEKRALTALEIDNALAEMGGWQSANGELRKTFRFGSFAKAIGWMVSVAIFADKLDHHPEWTNVYNRVSVRLTTHDMGNVVTTLDLELAREMERLVAQTP